MKIRGQVVYPPRERVARLSAPEPMSGCWIWVGGIKTNASGLTYGNIMFGSRTNNTRKSISAHRYSYMAHNGEIPKGMNVLHKCDNPLCVNPDHLWLGTQRDNMVDCYQKGRIRNANGIIKPTLPARKGGE